MRRFLNSIITLGTTLAINTFCMAQPALPAGISQGLFAWYEASDFRENTQTWPARFGGATLNSLTLDNSQAKLVLPYDQHPHVEMKGVGFRAEMLPNDANASYTVFAVANRISGPFQSVYQEMTWGMGRSSAFPGVALDNPNNNTPNPRFYFSSSR
jgi:hypothetical protein